MTLVRSNISASRHVMLHSSQKVISIHGYLINYVIN